MGQGSKNKTVFKSPVEITLINVYPSSFYCLIQIRGTVFIASAKILEQERSISSSSFYEQLANY